MPIALILVDALSAFYPSEETLPVLQSRFRRGSHGALKNMYAYRGIEASIFSGSTPLQHGVWGEYSPKADLLARERSSERINRYLIEVFDCIPSDRLRGDARFIVDRVGHPRTFSPVGNLIPGAVIHKFSRSMTKPIWESNSLWPIKTIFDRLREKGLFFETVIYPYIRSDNQIVSYTKSVLEMKHPDFWYIKFSVLDGLGHLFGPNVSRLTPALSTLNGQLDGLIGLLEKSYPEGVDIIIIGDHGMSEVTRAIDVRPLIRKIKARFGKDYLCFLDSTTARFWSEDPLTLEKIRSGFSHHRYLHELEKEDYNELQLPGNDSIGNIIYYADEGTVIFPDFFRREMIPGGMHGYPFVHSNAGFPFFAIQKNMSDMLPKNQPIAHTDIGKLIMGRLGL